MRRLRVVHSLMILLGVLAPLVASAVVLATSATGHLAGRVATIGCGAAFVAALWLAVASARDEAGVAGELPGLDGVDLRIDRASSLLLLLVAATGAVIAAFSRRNLDDVPYSTRYFALIGVVVAGSALVVVPGGPVALVIGWLISGWALAAITGRSGRRIARTLVIGDVALVAAVVIGVAASSAELVLGSPIAAAELADTSIVGVSALDLVAILLVVAGASRSALFPFHRWLIATLAAPTPVSALVHAGFVSGAGLLLIRFSGVFVASDVAVVLAFVLGLVTVVVATVASASRPDVKGGLAWSTVAQMSFMVVQCAVGAFSSAVFHIIGHGMYKAALFLGSGDTVSASVRSTRRPVAARALSVPARGAVSAVVATASVALVGWFVTPEVGDSGQVLIYAFAWASVASALWGWLARGPLLPAAAVASGTAVSALATLAYFAGLRLVERHVAPSFSFTPSDTIIGPIAVAVVAAVLAAAGAWLWSAERGGSMLALSVRQAVLATTRVPVSTLVAGRPAGGEGGLVTATDEPVRRAEIRADVSRAGSVIAPQWPLSSFVAVNPLNGLEGLGFDAATARARQTLRGRTHLSLAEYRADHECGLTTPGDLRRAVEYRFMELCARTPIDLDGRLFDIAEVVIADLLHGPEGEPAAVPRTELERRAGIDSTAVSALDDVLGTWIAGFVEPAHWPLAQPNETLVAMAQRLAGDARLRPHLSNDAVVWIGSLDSEPAHVIDSAFASLRISDDDRVSEMSGHLAAVQGWAGYAKWRTEWAQPDDPRQRLSMVDIVAVRAMLEAAMVATVATVADTSNGADAATERADAVVHARVDAVLAHLGVGPSTSSERARLRELLTELPDDERRAVWLAAQEVHVDDEMLSLLDRPEPGPVVDRPDAQIVLCIDVRSEGFRRHLESFGRDQTIGFAGFFGIPMKVRQLGWEHAEARCPVLVAPAVEAVERAEVDGVAEAARRLAKDRAVAGVHAAHSQSKYAVGAPFVMAETVGWLLGPLAAARTFLPGSAKPSTPPPTTVAIDEVEALVEQRVFFAESVLNTMGLVDGFAPIVALCGHTSRTANNAHATALECGACAGAAGDGNARAVASLLNSPDVRHGLIERGIEIPDDTWFVAGLHETVSDRLQIVDTVAASGEHLAKIDELQRRLDQAGALQAADRAGHLPGPAATVRDRGIDWAQVRPEWGLARNAAFVIGPRSLTSGLDLGGRAFLHSYDQHADPTGKVLETIMTAPLVVGHWISSQYYFSTVDPEVFGAGDKLLHNPIGSAGVFSGEGGDLRVGLPLQSTHVDGARHHQAVRLLAVIEADIARIERIIQANPILQTLTRGSWLRIAARSQAGEPWSTRTSEGTWLTAPRSPGADLERAFDPSQAFETT